MTDKAKDLPNKITGKDFLYGVMSGKYKTNMPNFKAKMDAAKTLIGYEVPRLNAVDATVKTVEMTHEQWLDLIDKEDENDE